MAKTRAEREETALKMMRGDLRLVRAINDENVGTDEEREKAIHKRCEEAGYSDEIPPWTERASTWGW